jgi:hypothetical protein
MINYHHCVIVKHLYKMDGLKEENVADTHSHQLENIILKKEQINRF